MCVFDLQGFFHMRRSSDGILWSEKDNRHERKKKNTSEIVQFFVKTIFLGSDNSFAKALCTVFCPSSTRESPVPAGKNDPSVDSFRWGSQRFNRQLL